MKKIILLLLIFSAQATFAQKDTLFFNADWKKCSKAEAVYFRLVEKQGGNYLVKDMFMKTNTPQMVAISTTADEELMKEGKCTFYLENGMKEMEGVYKQNKRMGIWVFWDDGGKDSSVTNYKENGRPDFIRTSAKETARAKEAPLSIVEKMPEYPGGYEAMGEFMKANIIYPDKAKKDGIKGTCYVTFYVDTDGSLKDVHVLRGIPNGEILDAEAVRVVKMMPKWEPGTQNDKVVKVQFNLPIKFK